MVAYALYRADHICQIKILINRMLGVTGHPEFLPYHQAIFVAEFIEAVAFCYASSPQTQQVDSFVVTLTLKKGDYEDKTEYLFLIGEMGFAPKQPILDFVKLYKNK